MRKNTEKNIRKQKKPLSVQNLKKKVKKKYKRKLNFQDI